MPDLAAKPATGAAAEAPAVGPERAAAITELGIAFRSAFRSLRSLRGRDTHRGDELGHAQYELLAELCAHGPLQAGELAEAVEASAATVSGMLDHLSEADLVERTRSDTDLQYWAANYYCATNTNLCSADSGHVQNEWVWRHGQCGVGGGRNAWRRGSDEGSNRSHWFAHVGRIRGAFGCGHRFS